MTRRFCPTFGASLALALAAAGPASAQPPVRDRRGPEPPASQPPSPSRPAHTVKVAFRVDGFSPTSGRAGTPVTIRGKGFTSSTSVLVGGSNAMVVSWKPDEILFEMPEVPGDAEIILRKPGGSSDLRVGFFHTIVDPEIGRMSPMSGAPGTSVELLGRGFEREDRLTIRGSPMRVTEWTPERLVVTVPEGAASDYILLSRPTGERARSPERFRVLAGVPAIASFNPEFGPPGTRVRIVGSGFNPRDRVLYGAMALPVLGRGGGWVDVEVPRRATRSDFFQVRGPHGVGKSPQPFALDLAQVLTRFSPGRGAPGTQVDLHGKNFREGDWVSLAGKRVPIVHLAPARISVTIPIGAQSGKFVVGRDRHQATSAGSFEVLNPPTLTAFTPTRGEPGTRVTLTGNHLTGAEVFYGVERIPVRSAEGGNSLVVEIPRAARDERFQVRTRAGSTQSSQVFQVQFYTVIDDAQPRAGTPGTTVVLSGRHLDKADDFYIGSHRLELIARDNNSATCKIPERARTASIAWVTLGRRDATTWRFEVLARPVILQFQPTDGPPGTEIIIRGDHIDERTQARFGQLPLRVVRVTPPHEIVVQLPRKAAGSEYLYLEGNGVRTRSDQSFDVKVAPIIQSVVPSAARPGQQVVVRGQWFTDATEILIGKVRSRVLRRDLRGGSILIEVPRDVPPGSHVMKARGETQTLVSEYRRPFVVLPGASISGLAPDRARSGERVRVDGTTLDENVRIWFGAIELPIVKRSPGGKQVWVVIPDWARGTAYLEIDDGGGRQTSSVQLTIEEPGPRRPGRGRDHRGEKPGKPR